MKKLKNSILYILFAIIGLGIFIGLPYYIVLSNHEFYFDSDIVKLENGNEYQIDLIPKDERFFDINDYVFESENPDIAEVTKSGKVIAKKEGKVKIKVKYKYSFIYKTIEIEITNNIEKIEKVTIDKNNVTLVIGETIRLKAIAEPANIETKNVIWTSSNSNIAYVDSNGDVTGLNVGTATITVVTANGKKDKSKIIVKEKKTEKEKEKNKEKIIDMVTINLKTTTYTGSSITTTGKSKSGSKVTITYYSDSNCKTPISVPKAAGTYYAIGKTTGNAKYTRAASKCTKAVVINKKKDSIIISLKTATYNGSGITTAGKSSSGLKVTITYYSDSNCKMTTSMPKAVGTYYAIGKTTGNAIYAGATSACTKAVVIDDKVEEINDLKDIVTINLKTITYTGSGITTTGKSKSGSKVTITYYSDSSCMTPISVPKAVGTYYAIGRSAGNATYAGATSACTKAVVIYKKSDSVTISLKTATYTGNSIATTGKAASGSKVTITYYSDSSCKTPISVPKAAGTYYAIGRSAGNATFAGATSTCTKAVVINKKKDSITIALKIATYTGGNITTAGKSKSGLKVKLTYYSDSKCKTFTATPKNIGTYYAIGTTVGNAAYIGVKSACTKAVVIIKPSVKKITLKPTKLELSEGMTGTVKATITPSVASTNLTWKSSNTTIATVDSKGNIIAKKAGTATITVSTNDNKVSANLELIVKKVQTKEFNITMDVGTSKVLSESLSKAYKNLTFTSSNLDVATVNSKGKVVANKSGSTMVTAKFNDIVIAKYKITSKDLLEIYFVNTSKLKSSSVKTSGADENVIVKTSNNKIIMIDVGSKNDLRYESIIENLKK